MRDPNGTANAVISGCEVCLCNCCVGLFKDSERQDIARAKYEEILRKRKIKEKAGPASMESTFKTLASAISTGMKQGMLKLGQSNTDVSSDSVRGALAGSLKNFQFADAAEHHYFREAVGPVTDRFPDGTHVKTFSGSTSKGMRHYNGDLDKQIITLSSSSGSSDNDTVSYFVIMIPKF